MATPTFSDLSEDRLLRNYGFIVVARPKTGPVLWRRQNKTYPQNTALRIVHREQVEQESLKGGVAVG